ncbi:MAG: RNA polymerase sigma factor [Flavitalea sp.]
MGTTQTYSEQELVSLLRNRDSRAFGYLYDNYSGALLGIINQIVDDVDLANDVLQDVFVNIWRKIESYDSGKGRLFTWMLNIARNASIDLIRSSAYQNMRRTKDFDDSFEIGSGADLAKVDHIGLKKVLEKLKEEHRVLVELSYFKGYTHEEISEIEDIPLGTVKTRIRNALKHLREILK